MHKTLSAAALALLMSGAPLAAEAKKKPAAAPAAPAEPAHAPRKLSELADKFKWGISPDDVMKLVEKDIHTRYSTLITKEPEILRQDQLRAAEQEELQKAHESLVHFKSQKTGWETSIVGREFAPDNDEAMIVLWESNQRRFLFFYHDKLYKQYIAFNAEYAAFAGKTFDDFVGIIENRYGPSTKKTSVSRTNKDAQTLDHLEWPTQGADQLWAIDQSGFYGNFCLVLRQTSVAPLVDKAHAERIRQGRTSNALIDSVTKPGQQANDPNADIIDSIIGSKPSGTIPPSK